MLPFFIGKPTLFTNVCAGIFIVSATYIAIQKRRSIPTIEQIIETERQEEYHKNKKNQNNYNYNYKY